MEGMTPFGTILGLFSLTGRGRPQVKDVVECRVENCDGDEIIYYSYGRTILLRKTKPKCQMTSCVTRDPFNHPYALHERGICSFSQYHKQLNLPQTLMQPAQVDISSTPSEAHAPLPFVRAVLCKSR